jgi:Ala-tRNA(Pro) deacylase
MDKKLEDYLKKHNVKYTLHEHPAVFTVEESSKIKKEIPGLATKSLFLKEKNGKFYLISLPGVKRLDTKKLKKQLDTKKLNFASPEELKSELNITPGSVSIFCLINADPNKVEFILDQEIWDAQISGFHPNRNTATLEITHESLENYYKSLPCKKQILKL